MRTRARIPNQRRKQRGGILIDALIALIILSFAAVSFFSYFPVLHKTHVLGAEEQKATQMANKMCEHINLFTPYNLNASTLTAAGLIDTGQSASPYTFSNIPLDDGTKYSPSEALRNGTGQIEVTDLANNSKAIKVTISWKSETGKNKSVVMGTVIGGWRS